MDAGRPYFVHEEEVPWVGTRMSTALHRARSYDGRPVIWLGTRRGTGRGEASSGQDQDQQHAVGPGASSATRRFLAELAKELRTSGCGRRRRERQRSAWIRRSTALRRRRAPDCCRGRDCRVRFEQVKNPRSCITSSTGRLWQGGTPSTGDADGHRAGNFRRSGTCSRRTPA